MSQRLPLEQQFNYVKRSGVDIAAARQLARLCKQTKPDLVHAHDSHSHTTCILAAILFRNATPIILSRRVDFPIGSSWFSKFKYNHKKIRAIVCVSDTIKEIVRPQITAQHIHLTTVHSGVNPDKFQGVQVKDLRAELRLEKDIRIVANVAALADHKDYFTFLDTAKKLSSDRQDVRFLIFGSGNMEQELKAYCSKLDLNAYTYFMGFRQDLNQLYPNFDALLFPSKTEGLGTSILDAWANNVPVVATRAGGIPEMIIHEETGLLADVGDAGSLAAELTRILDDRKLRETVTQNAQKHLKKFTVNEMVRKTTSEYQNILNN